MSGDWSQYLRDHSLNPEGENPVGDDDEDEQGDIPCLSEEDEDETDI